MKTILPKIQLFFCPRDGFLFHFEETFFRNLPQVTNVDKRAKNYLGLELNQTENSDFRFGNIGMTTSNLTFSKQL